MIHSISNGEIIFLWVLMAILVAVFEHELSAYRHIPRKLIIYIAINLMVWYITITDWIIIKRVTNKSATKRRKK